MRATWTIILAMATAVAVSCGGGAGALLDAGAGQVTGTGSEAGGSGSGLIEDASGWAGAIPALPLDIPGESAALDPGKGASATGGDEGGYSVSGLDYMQAYGQTEGDDGLLLKSLEEEMAWAMYKISGLEGKEVASLAVECIPGSLGEEYFVGVGSFTNRHWQWSSTTLPEFVFELRDDETYVSPLGNLYFVVAVYDGASCTVIKGTAIVDGGGGTRRPHAPIHLEASDGTQRGGILLRWQDSAKHDNYYLVLRKPVSDLERHQADGLPGDGEERDRPDDGGRPHFRIIGRSEETHFFDDNANPNVLYAYMVAAVNRAGRSGHSNVDTGYWASDAAEPGYFIKGKVVTRDGNGVAEVTIGISAGDRSRRTLTDDEGYFGFRNLPPGVYVLTPYLEGASFEPGEMRVDLSEGSVRGLVFYIYRDTDEEPDG
ncbi:carboxypeptidase regulatory-like domain-containing protein [bacterium]|nr:carboxypeptidase regulatory-like domain-containing protein [bacterium]